MSRRFKTMGLALTSLLAIGAVFASSALAQFESNAEEVALSVKESEPQEFEIQEGGLTVSCYGLSYSHGVQDGFPERGIFVTAEISATPLYSNCEPVLGQNTSVDTNLCEFVSLLGKGATTGFTDLDCLGEGIEIHIGTICTYEVESQLSIGFVSFENKEGGTIKITPDVHGMTSSLIQGGFLCPAAGREGAYEGSATIEGDGGFTLIFVD